MTLDEIENAACNYVQNTLKSPCFVIASPKDVAEFQKELFAYTRYSAPMQTIIGPRITQVVTSLGQLKVLTDRYVKDGQWFIAEEDPSIKYLIEIFEELP